MQTLALLFVNLLLLTSPPPSQQLRRPPPLSRLAWPIEGARPPDANLDRYDTTDDQHPRQLADDGDTSPLELPTPEDHLVTSLPLLSNENFPSNHYAGHIPTTSLDRQLFYWLFEPSSADGDDTSSAPLLIWLNGGPGCSSMDGLFLENGPFRLVSDPEWRIDINEFSWHNAPAWVLYLDQPVGTGLSFTRDGRYCRNDEEVNEDFYAFLINFLRAYSDFFLSDDDDDGSSPGRTSRQLFFAGESHAGHYIPSMMDYILQRNDADPEISIALGGAAIGNGWVDPYNQYAAATAAYGTGLIDMAQWAELNRKEEECQKQMDGGDLDAKVCFTLLDKIIEDSNGAKDYKVSVYDDRVWEVMHEPRSFPEGHMIVEAFLGNVKNNKKHQNVAPKMTEGLSDGVLEAIHATEATRAGQFYKECTDPPFNALVHQDGKGVVPELVRVLSHPDLIPILFFNGMNDLMCNHASNERFLDLLPWDYAKEWSLSTRSVWNGVDKKGIPAGYVKHYRNLILLKIKDSGHMVPMDQPELSLEMMRVLMFGDANFEDKSQSTLGAILPGKAGDCGQCPAPKCNDDKSNFLGPDDESNIGKVSDSEENESNFFRSFELRHFTIAGAWMGALLACIALFLYLKKMTRISFNQVETDDVEMESHRVPEMY